MIRAILWKAASSAPVRMPPLLFTSLNNQFFSLDMGKPIANLPVVIFNYALSAYDDWRRLAWVGALVIAAAVLAINVAVRTLAREKRRP